MTALAKSNKMITSVATSMLASTHDRIFAQGKNSNNSGLGKYSKGYMDTRKRNNWGTSTKIILQATRQMVNDFSVISSGQDVGLGFKNQNNADKSEYVESTYNTKIFKHTKDELKLLDKLLTKEVKKALR